MLAYLLRRTRVGRRDGARRAALPVRALLPGDATPEDVARRALGEKAPPEAIAQWLTNHGYDKPAVWNPEQPLDTLLAEHFRRMLIFDFGRSDADDVPIAQRLRDGVGPSLSVTVPLFVLGLPLALSLALLVAFFRETYIDRAGVVLCVLAMSVSMLLYILGGQFLLGKLLRWFPISGFDPDPSVLLRFVALPVAGRPARRRSAPTCASTAPSSSRRAAATTCARRAPRAPATPA